MEDTRLGSIVAWEWKWERISDVARGTLKGLQLGSKLRAANLEIDVATTKTTTRGGGGPATSFGLNFISCMGAFCHHWPPPSSCRVASFSLDVTKECYSSKLTRPSARLLVQPSSA